MSRSTTLAVMLLTFVIYLSSPSIAGDISKSKAGTFLGEAKMMGNGVAWSWVERNTEGEPTSIGVTFTETALTGLPETMPSTGLPGWEYELALPREAGIEPFDHIVIDWNPKGHIPPGIYDVPHFDFHFYLINQKVRAGITAKDSDLTKCKKKPAAKFIPADYILPEGTEVPRMGVHWIDPSAPEFNQQPFTKTFIYGSYDGRITFIEPMITKAFLETRTDVTEAIKLPEAFQKPGYYPTSYRLKYDPVRKEYTVELEGLTRRE